MTEILIDLFIELPVKDEKKRKNPKKPWSKEFHWQYVIVGLVLFLTMIETVSGLMQLICKPGARFTNIFLPAIQIRWKLRLAITPLLAIRSQQSFAHATTAQLSCHVQKYVAITVLEWRWDWNEISIEFELRWKNS